MNGLFEVCGITRKARATDLKLNFRQWFKPIKRRIVDVVVGPKLYHLTMTEGSQEVLIGFYMHREQLKYVHANIILTDKHGPF